MRVKLQLVMCNDQGDEEIVTEAITFTKHHQRIEHLGLTLAESKRFCRKVRFLGKIQTLLLDSGVFGFPGVRESSRIFEPIEK